MDEIEQIIGVLERYLSPLNARALIQRAQRTRKFGPGPLSRSEMRELGNSLQRGLRLFLHEPEASLALKDIMALCEGTKSAGPSSIPVVTENDIITARMEARRVCDDLGAKSFAAQKVTTIVSELARNIVSYTPGGKVEISTMAGRRRILVRATDTGTGIPNLAEVMSGNYRSKTGLGRGLLGTKRLADHFDVATGAAGTSIVAEIEV